MGQPVGLVEFVRNFLGVTLYPWQELALREYETAVRSTEKQQLLNEVEKFMSGLER